MSEPRLYIVASPSGGGKSSLINALMGGQAQRTAAISSKSGEGRHTTVNSVMLDLPGGGRVIDSPGVRDYAPAFLRRKIGFVLQTSFLFSTTVKKNWSYLGNRNTS